MKMRILFQLIYFPNLPMVSDAGVEPMNFLEGNIYHYYLLMKQVGTGVRAK